MAMTEWQVIQWLKVQKRRYDLGRLTPDQRAKLESLPGWPELPEFDWRKYLRVEPRVSAGIDGWGIYTLSHNECVGECLSQASAELWAHEIAKDFHLSEKAA